MIFSCVFVVCNFYFYELDMLMSNWCFFFLVCFFLTFDYDTLKIITEKTANQNCGQPDC